MKITPFLLAAGTFLLLITSEPVHATVFTLEDFDMTGTLTATAGGDSGSTAFSGSLTVGTPATLPNWNLSALSLELLDCCPNPATWDFSNLEIDADTLDLNGTLIGTWTGSGGKPNRFTGTFVDSTTNFTWVREKDSGGGFGIFSSGNGTYALTTVPEPSTGWLAGSVLAGLAVWRCGRRSKRSTTIRAE